MVVYTEFCDEHPSPFAITEGRHLSQASVKAIDGEPVSAQGKTVIPVAQNNVCLWCRSGHRGRWGYERSR